MNESKPLPGGSGGERMCVPGGRHLHLPAEALGPPVPPRPWRRVCESAAAAAATSCCSATATEYREGGARAHSLTLGRMANPASVRDTASNNNKTENRGVWGGISEESQPPPRGGGFSTLRARRPRGLGNTDNRGGDTTARIVHSNRAAPCHSGRIDLSFEAPVTGGGRNVKNAEGGPGLPSLSPCLPWRDSARVGHRSRSQGLT